MEILIFFLVLFVYAHAALNESLYKLNQKFSVVLGTKNNTLELFGVLANISLPNEVSISVGLFNNSLENCLEIHYFEYSSDWNVELAYSRPLFRDVVWISAGKVEDKISKFVNFSYERFGVVTGRSQAINVESSHEIFKKVKLSEFTVYFDDKMFKVALVNGLNVSFLEIWPVGEVQMEDSVVIYHIFLACFLLVLILTLIFYHVCKKVG